MISTMLTKNNSNIDVERMVFPVFFTGSLLVDFIQIFMIIIIYLQLKCNIMKRKIVIKIREVKSVLN